MHCAELQDPVEEPDVVPEVDPVEVVEVVVVVRGCGSGSFSQETKNIAVSTVAMSSNFFIPQSNKKNLTLPNKKPPLLVRVETFYIDLIIYAVLSMSLRVFKDPKSAWGFLQYSPASSFNLSVNFLL